MDAEILLNLQERTRSNMKKDHLEAGVDPDEIHDTLFPEGREIAMLTHELEANTLGIHSHSFFEINYVCAGECEQTLENGSKVLLKRGNILIMNPHSRHQCRTTGTKDILINIILEPSFFNAAFLSFMNQNNKLGSFFMNYVMSVPTDNNYLFFPLEYSRTINRTIEHMIEEFLCEDPYSSINLKCLFAMLLSELLRSNSALQATEEGNKTQEIMDYLSENIANASLQSTADHFYMHPNYLSSYIKKNTGRSFKEITLTLKTAYAQNLLLNSSLTFDEISEKLGYTDPVSFHNMFKRQTGYTPAAYRATNAKPLSFI